MDTELQSLGETYIQMVRRDIQSLLNEKDRMAVSEEVDAIEVAMRAAHSSQDGQMIDEVQLKMVALEKRLFFMERLPS